MDWRLALIGFAFCLLALGGMAIGVVLGRKPLRGSCGGLSARDGRPDPLGQGLEQLDAYLARLGLDEGVLVLFDRRAGAAPIDARTRFEAATTATGRAVTVLRA